MKYLRFIVNLGRIYYLSQKSCPIPLQIFNKHFPIIIEPKYLVCILLKQIHGLLIVVSPDESRGYLGFSTVTPPPPQRFPFGRDNLKNILVRTFKFGMWVYMGNATNAIVL